MKNVRFFITICIGFILFAIAAWFFKSYKMPPELHKETNEIKNETGVSFHISDFKGRYVLLSYFQTWCGDCIKELQSMDALQMKIGKDKLQIILVSDEPWEKINRFKEKYCNTLDYYQSTATLHSQNIRVFPTTYLLDQSGNVLISKINAFDWSRDEVLQRIK